MSTHLRHSKDYLLIAELEKKVEHRDAMIDRLARQRVRRDARIAQLEAEIDKMKHADEKTREN